MDHFAGVLYSKIRVASVCEKSYRESPHAGACAQVLLPLQVKFLAPDKWSKLSKQLICFVEFIELSVVGQVHLM